MMPADWEPYTAKDESEFDPLLEEALDSVIEAVNTLQVLAYVLTGRPTTPLAPQNLPFSIFFAVGLLDDELRVSPHPKGSFGHFTNYLGVQAHELRHHATEDAPTAEAMDSVPLGPFDKVAQLAMEAESLLRLTGQFRASLIMAAAACEALLDTTLMMLLWESSVRPEVAAKEFNAQVGIKTRVARNYPVRLRGNWNPRQVPALRNWQEQVVEPRNQIVHLGASITRQDAENAFAAYSALLDFIVNRLWDNLKAFPFTAITYSASLRAAPEGANQLFVKFPGDTYEPPSAANFGRWVDCVAVIIDHEAPRRGSTSSGGLLAVAPPSANPYWVWHDWTSAMARLVDEPDQATRDALIERLRLHRPLHDVTSWLSFSFNDQTPPAAGPWVEEHNLIPGLELLPDGSDLNRHVKG